MKRIVAILLVVLMLCQMAAYAEIDANTLSEKFLTDLIPIDRAMKYDYASEEETEGKETLKFPEAVRTVLALDIMQNEEDGTFYEDKPVAFKDFSYILSKLYAIDGSEELTSSHPDNRFATQNEAAYYLVAAVGYDIYESRYRGDFPRTQIARNAGILQGIEFKGEKNITRGELAQMIYNTLQIEIYQQTSYGGVLNYERVEGETLLYNRFNANLIQGTVTAQYGISLYNDSSVSADSISIDRVQYPLVNKEVGDILGRRVVALVQSDDIVGHQILDVFIDKRDETLVIPLDDVVSMNASAVRYIIDGKEKTQSLSKVKNFSVNGKGISPSEVMETAESAEGEIRLIKTERGGSYTIALIRDWSSFIVERISMLDECIYLDYGATFDGKRFIDYSDMEELVVLKDGVLSDATEIKAGSIIDVMQSADGENLLIHVTDSSVMGTLEGETDEKVVIDGVEYGVSPSYKEACKYDSTLQELELGIYGNFRFNVLGKIADFTAKENSVKIGLLAKFGEIGSGLNSEVAIRLLTEDNVWVNVSLAEELTFDGYDNVSQLDAIEEMKQNSESICYAPVRYKLNSKGEICFLDTANVKEDAELDDPNTIRKETTYVGEMNWTIANGAAGTLSDSEYFIGSELCFIEIPKDREDETMYLISSKHNLQNTKTYTLHLYNVDRFNSAGIIVKDAATSTATLSQDGTANMYVFLGLGGQVNKKGEIEVVMNAFTNTSRTPLHVKYKVMDSSLIEIAETLNKGDIILMETTTDEVKFIKTFANAEELFTVDLKEQPSKLTQYGLGTVTAIDVKNNMIAVDIDGTEIIWKKNVWDVALYDVSSGRGEVIAMGDIRVGDRIYGIGAYNSMQITVLRK